MKASHMRSLGDVAESNGNSPKFDIIKKIETMDIKLMSSEGKIFDVAEEVARQCETIEHMIEDSCGDGIIPLPNVSTKTLELVLEWSKKKTIQSEIKDFSRDGLNEWEKEFFNLDRDTLYHLFIAANYLCHRRLLDHCAEKVASLIRNRTPEEIREIFDINNDFTSEEYENVKAPNAWAYEQ